MLPVPVVIHELFRCGGKALIDVLQYCVISVQMDPVFVFLDHEYRLEPTISKSRALYELFCVPDAPAKVSTYQALPPRNLRLRQSMERFQANELAGRTIIPEEQQSSMPATVPGKELFDAVVNAIRSSPTSGLGRVMDQFDPSRSPLENLPGGKMTAAQKFFVDKVWQPIVRPRLIAAGFRRIANVG